MERLEPPAQWVSIPVQELEHLHGEIKRLRAEIARLRAVLDQIAAEDDE